MDVPRRLLAVVAAGLLAADAGLAAGQQSARFMYEEAFAREHVLRADLDAREPGVVRRPTVQQLRAVIAAYENVVRRYPTSGYCDNALWQAAGLAGEAARRWGQDRDRRTAAHLLRLLVQEYPASSLVPKARGQLASYDAIAAAVPAPPAAAPAATKNEPPPPPVATLRTIRRTALTDVMRVTIEFDQEVQYRTERLDDPPRVLFDFAPARMGPGLAEGLLRDTADAAPRVRVGRHPVDTTRVVLDLDGVRRYSVFPLYNPYRLVVDCEPEPPAAAARRAEVPAVTAPPPAPLPPPPALESRGVSDAVTLRSPADRGLPPPPVLASAPLATVYARPPTSVASGLGSAATASDPAGSPAKPSAPAPSTARPAITAQPPEPAPEKPVPPAANIGGGFSLSRQLGLGVSRIVIDPGHGGHDPGAEGAGTTEAEVVLDVAHRLEKLLREQPGVEVVMTRSSDEFVPLEQRTAAANRAQADLFLSIHANASRNRSANGVETYFLNFAISPDAEAVAARENASTDRTMNKLPDIVRAIALNNKLDESRDFARLVQQAMVRRLRGANTALKDLGVKQAPFVVLIGAAMPSVLVEISFITNVQEGRLLRNTAYRQRIADALFDGITRYQRSLKAAAPLRPQ